MEKERVSQYEIREGTLDDSEAVRRMQAESWLATYPNDEAGVSYEWVKEQTDQWLTSEWLAKSREILAEVLEKPNSFYSVAEMEGRIVGFVHVATNDDNTKELEAIYTSPETFGTGLGDRLMERADQWIDDVTTTLKVVSYNQRAIRFYEKHGFIKVEGSEEVYKEKMPVIQMIRKGGMHEV